MRPQGRMLREPRERKELLGDTLIYLDVLA